MADDRFVATDAERCGHCGGPGKLRCTGCHVTIYCSRACQKSAWPSHKVPCRRRHAPAPPRDAALDFWRPHLPDSCDVDTLVPLEMGMSEAALFERCQGACMETFFPGYAAAGTDAGARRVVAASLARMRTTRTSPRSLAWFAEFCVDRFCPVALEVVMDAGAWPGDQYKAASQCVLTSSIGVLRAHRYARSAAVLPHALGSIRLLLARARPGDWLVGPDCESMPLYELASITDPAVSHAVLDLIAASPGGFPAHAVAASSPAALNMAAHSAPASLVRQLLRAGADANAAHMVHDAAGMSCTRLPLHMLVASNIKCGGVDFEEKLRLLLDAGADVEGANGLGWTPLVAAAMSEFPAAFDALLLAGAKTSALRKTMRLPTGTQTLLHFLATVDQAVLLERVLATGALGVDARVDARTGPAGNKQTPLHAAAVMDSANAVRVLLAAGASLTAVDENGDDALLMAIRFSAARAARLLVDATPPRKRTLHAAMAMMAAGYLGRPGAPMSATAVADLAAAQEIAAMFG